MDFSLATLTIPSVASPAPLVSVPPASISPRPYHTQPTVPLVDLEYGAEDETQEPQSDVLAEQPVLFNDEQAENGQVGGARTQKRIEFKESACRRLFRKALLCKSFTPQDEYADRDTVRYAFSEVIQQELFPILAEHPGVKAWIDITNLYDYHDKSVDRKLSIKTAPIYIGSEGGIAPLIVRAEKFIIGRKSSFTVWSSDLDYFRNINITLTVVEWDMRAPGGPTKAIK